jgi:UDP-N-acetylmuramate dehydrogenase
MRKLSAPENLEKIIRRNGSLAGLTTWGVGGTAKMLVSPRNVDELELAVRWIYSDGLECHVIGGGSNTLVSDGEIDIPIISTKMMTNIDVSRRNGEVFLKCEAGSEMRKIFALSAKEGWSGLECTAGIPGTIGGALIGNAGTPEGEVASVVECVELFDERGAVKTLRRDEIEWGYRRSSLAVNGKIFVASVVIKLRESTREVVMEAAKKTIALRKSQPVGTKTAGCVFKNPVGYKAGRLLDESGCKRLELGGARVSAVHANFIENYAHSTAMDIVNLAMSCRNKVREKFGVTLMFEVKPVGFAKGFLEG